MKNKLAILICLTLIISSLTACKSKNQIADTSSDYSTSASSVATDVSTDKMDFELTNRDLDSSYDESSATTVSENEDVIDITKDGIYIISGNHSQIVVNASDSAKIQIVLKGAKISNKNGPAIYIKSADKVFISADNGSTSTVSDVSSYSSDYESDNVDGAIFSKADLTLNGSGTLNINGNYKCGIVSKDDLVISSLTLNVTSVGCAIEGKDCIKSSNATLTLKAGGDGMKSTNEEDSSRGFITIDSGTYNITSENDAIQAKTVINITGGTFNLTTGGGSANSSTSSKNQGWGMWGKQSDTNSSDSSTTSSAKGFKATSLIKISSATITVDSSDDSIHSNSDVQIDSGTFKLTSGDDGIHGDDALLINGGTVSITKSYEGLEATTITITGGKIDVTASDDGINAAGGNDSSAMGGRPGQNSFNSTSNASINVNGGYVLVNASGDGIDSNGSISMTGGVLLVSGPTDNGNGSFDYDSSATITGGIAILSGSSGMAQTFADSSSQCSVMYTFNSSVNGGNSIAITDSNGKVIASFLPSKQYNNVVISTPDLKKDGKYKLQIGGTVSGCDSNGFTSTGSVSGATNTYDIDISSTSVTYGSAGGMGGGGGMGGNRPQNRF